jgi:hypothetical protein
MSRVWYCRNCGYEVTSRGRCHACKERLVPSALPELEPGPEDDEVGYQLEDWSDSDRGWLIEQLNDLGVVHRFEGDELVVDAADEDRVDDLVSLLSDGAAPGAGSEAVAEPHPVDDPAVVAAVRLLADAAARLHIDPTDMQADADVGEVSAAVLMAERFGSLDEELWSAVGRVTRRLLSLLGAEEALDEQIRAEAAVLEKLLSPVVPSTAAVADVASGEQTVYELADWLPEQRAELGVLLDEAGVPYGWDGDELLVAADREADAEALFERVGGGEIAEEGDFDAEESRYQAVAELFAACGRLAGDPLDSQKAAAVVDWAAQAQGPPLLGMDEVDWFHIMTRTRALVSSIEADDDPVQVAVDAGSLHDLLRRVV